MPEQPDIDVYLGALETRILGRKLQDVRLKSPFLLRTVTPRADAVKGRRAVALRRLGKRICIGLEGDLWLVLHLMIAGRLHWDDAPAAKIPGGKTGLAAFDFETGTLSLTEAGTKKRAALHILEGTDALSGMDPGGLETLACSPAEFAGRLRSGNHTLKRALTDPRLFSGIGNAYSDEILHRARLSPVALTRNLSDAEVARLFEATQQTLRDWTVLLKRQYGVAFPTGVTAFRPEMSVHGKYGQPCPDCGSPVQRIRYADNETNYCAVCQTGGKLLADRALSKLLKSDWPRSLDDLERLPTRD